MGGARETVLSSFSLVLIVWLPIFNSPLPPFPSPLPLSFFLRSSLVSLKPRIAQSKGGSGGGNEERSGPHKVEPGHQLSRSQQASPPYVLYVRRRREETETLQSNIDHRNISLAFCWRCSSFCLSVPRKHLEDPRDVLKTPLPPPSSLETGGPKNVTQLCRGREGEGEGQPDGGCSKKWIQK